MKGEKVRLKVLSSHANTCCQSTLFLLLLFPLADKLSTSKSDGSVGVFLLLRKLVFATFFPWHFRCFSCDGSVPKVA